ncbi:hypothetical protein [Streptomyces sp. NPDC058614]|uniref:hypothetical protein n=1 Tax=Streptomyces sp. NPDC058614 TaxID=3346557 RepID=UPI0036667577
MAAQLEETVVDTHPADAENPRERRAQQFLVRRGRLLARIVAGCRVIGSRQRRPIERSVDREWEGGQFDEGSGPDRSLVTAMTASSRAGSSSLPARAQPRSSS